MKKLFKSLLLIFFIVLFYGSDCGSPGLPGNPAPCTDSELVEMLQNDYYNNNETVPPSVAFSCANINFANYFFWDGGHIDPNNPYEPCETCRGLAFNTADPEFNAIAILYYEISLPDSADLVVEKLAENGNWTGHNPPWISSAYRNPRRNLAAGGDPGSRHIKGTAIDFDGDNYYENLALQTAVFDAGGWGNWKNGDTGYIHSWWPYP